MVPEILTVEEHDLNKMSMSLDKVIKFEKNEIKFEEEEELDEKDKESLYQKIRQIKKTYFIIQVYL